MKLIRSSIAFLVRLCFRVKPIESLQSENQPGVYFANHSSHLDYLLFWSVIPDHCRSKLHPVAAKDYWAKTLLRRFISTKLFNAVFIERTGRMSKRDPLAPLVSALKKGESLFIFPEGTRHTGENLNRLKSGIFHLHRKCPSIPLIPVWLKNCSRAFPKGALLPSLIPLGVSIGAPLKQAGGQRKQFLSAVENSLTTLQLS